MELTDKQYTDLSDFFDGNSIYPGTGDSDDSDCDEVFETLDFKGVLEKTFSICKIVKNKLLLQLKSTGKISDPFDRFEDAPQEGSGEVMVVDMYDEKDQLLELFEVHSFKTLESLGL